MDTLLYDLLLSLTAQGFLWSLLLLILCFGGVYAVELAKLGWNHRQDSPPKPKQETNPPAEKPQEPVYYLVERTKSGYKKPKPFHFKKE